MLESHKGISGQGDVEVSIGDLFHSKKYGPGRNDCPTMEGPFEKDA